MADTSNTIVEGLWNTSVVPPGYGKNSVYQDHLLEQYKLYVEMADRVSSRRNLANTFFLTLHTAIVAAGAVIYGKGFIIENKWWLVFPLVAVEALCFSWWQTVKSYRQLNTGKFKVIGEFEKRLPSSPYWAAEWKALGEGENPKLYRPLTSVENWVPAIFSVLYLIGVAMVILN